MRVAINSIKWKRNALEAINLDFNSTFDNHEDRCDLAWTLFDENDNVVEQDIATISGADYENWDKNDMDGYPKNWLLKELQLTEKQNKK